MVIIIPVVGGGGRVPVADVSCVVYDMIMTPNRRSSATISAIGAEGASLELGAGAAVVAVAVTVVVVAVVVAKRARLCTTLCTA